MRIWESDGKAGNGIRSHLQSETDGGKGVYQRGQVSCRVNRVPRK